MTRYHKILFFVLFCFLPFSGITQDNETTLIAVPDLLDSTTYDEFDIKYVITNSGNFVDNVANFDSARFVCIHLVRLKLTLEMIRLEKDKWIFCKSDSFDNILSYGKAIYTGQISTIDTLEFTRTEPPFSSVFDVFRHYIFLKDDVWIYFDMLTREQKIIKFKEGKIIKE